MQPRLRRDRSHRYSGKPIAPQDKIQAAQELPVWEQLVLKKAAEVAEDKRQKKESGYVPPETAHAPETRLQMARDLAAQKAEKEKNEKRRTGTEKKEAREIPGAYTARGDIRQCNEGTTFFEISIETKINMLPNYASNKCLHLDVEVDSRLQHDKLRSGANK